MVLGDEAFVSEFRGSRDLDELSEAPKLQRSPLSNTRDEHRQAAADLNDAMALTFLSGARSMKAIGGHFGIHYMNVSHAVHAYEKGCAKRDAYPGIRNPSASKDHIPAYAGMYLLRVVMECCNKSGGIKQMEICRARSGVWSGVS